MILALLGTFILYGTIALGCQPLPEGLIVGFNTLAISAACHSSVGDEDAAFLAV